METESKVLMLMEAMAEVDRDENNNK